MNKKSCFLFFSISVILICLILFVLYRRRGSIIVRPTQAAGVEQTQDNLQEFFFLQKDSAWKDDPLGTSSYTMGSSGCLTTCLTSAILLQDIQVEGLTDGDTLNPGILNAFLTAENVYDAAGNIQWEPLSTALDHKIIRKNAGEMNVRVLTSLLQEGIYPIVRVHMPVSELTHFVLLIGTDGDTFLCMDPLHSGEPRKLSYYGDRIYAVRYLDKQSD